MAGLLNILSFHIQYFDLVKCNFDFFNTIYLNYRIERVFEMCWIKLSNGPIRFSLSNRFYVVFRLWLLCLIFHVNDKQSENPPKKKESMMTAHANSHILQCWLQSVGWWFLVTLQQVSEFKLFYLSLSLSLSFAIVNRCFCIWSHSFRCNNNNSAQFFCQPNNCFESLCTTIPVKFYMLRALTKKNGNIKSKIHIYTHRNNKCMTRVESYEQNM